ncbi:hypothetical protein StoSoilB13_21670 [Arthrobacter sp. StoSoilB13]|nr:hypothetical protein StoSoilB13_21670 [Arthrobacter sp. StoSoilB13]
MSGVRLKVVCLRVVCLKGVRIGMVWLRVFCLVWLKVVCLGLFGFELACRRIPLGVRQRR